MLFSFLHLIIYKALQNYNKRVEIQKNLYLFWDFLSVVHLFFVVLQIRSPFFNDKQ